MAGEGPGERARVGGVFGDRVSRWAKILSAYFTAQTLTQLLGIAAGLLLVRFMPVGEYALYTLALSVITFFNFVSDLGSTTSLVHFFREDRDAFPRYLDAVVSLRRAAFLLGAAGVVVIFPWTAWAKGFGAAPIALATAGILLTVWFQIAASVRVLALRLADRYGPSYRADVTGGGVRFVAALAMVATGLLRAWIGVLASALSAAAVALVARPERSAETAEDLRPYRKKVLRYLLPTLPSALYFSIQGPLTVWLAATFGGTRNIAEVGALGRLGLLVGIFSSLIGVVFLPRLARIEDEKLYRWRVAQFGGFLAAIVLALLAAAAVAPDLFLLLLGRSYAGLHKELLLVVAGAGISLLDGYVVNVNLARSWTRWQGAAVVSLIAAQAAMVALLPLSTTAGVLSFNVLSGAVALLTQLAILGTGFTRPQWVYWA